MAHCRVCDGSLAPPEKEKICGCCLAVLPDILQVPNMDSIRYIDEDLAKFREQLGEPRESLREIWNAVRSFRPGDEDIDWLFNDLPEFGVNEWRWITTPPPAFQLDDRSKRFLGERLGFFSNNRKNDDVMRNLQRGGLLPCRGFLSNSGGQWNLDGRALEVPYETLSQMLVENNRTDINWSLLLRTIDLAVTQVYVKRSMLTRPTRGQTINPAFFLMTRSRGYSSKDLHVFKEGGSSRLSWFPSDFGKALWLRSWQMSGAHGGVSGRPDLRRRRDIFGLMEADEALQHSSLTIRKGRLCMKVRRPGGAFRIITVPPQPELVARLASWFLSHPNSMRFRRFECLRTRIFAGEDTGLVEGPERVALKLLRSVYDSTDGCALAEDGRSFLIEGSSGLVYDVNSGIRGTGAHGSRFKIRCIGPVAEKGRPGLPHQRRHEDICIRESQGPKLPLGDLMVQAILTCSQDLQAASRIPSINAAIANWQGRMDQIDREQRRRADPLGEQFRVLERLAERVRGDWMHLRLRRVTASFPALWSTIIRAPVGSVMRFTSLENALMEPGRPNISFEDVSTRFRTQSNMERQVVRRMLMGAGWTRQTQEERRTGDRQIWHRMSRPDNRDLGAAINNFCGLLEIIVRVNGRRMPMAPEHLQLSFEADSGVYHTALLPASRGLIA